jgi:Ca2+-binding RTX toxin-like protein
MKRIARAVTITGITMGAAVLAAPSAMADINIYAVEKADIGHYGPTYVNESGPGNLNFSSVTGSPKASPKVGNESVKVDDINTHLKGGKGNTAINEVEGSEQDEGEGGGASAEQASAEQASAEGASAEGVQQSTLEAQEAAPQQEAAQQEAAQQEAAPQEAAQQEAAPQEAAPQEEAAQQEAAQQEAAPQEAAPQQEAAQQEAAPQEEAAQQEAAPQEQGVERVASDHKNGHDKNGHDKVKIAQWVKKSNIGHNGGTLAGEFGPGNLNFSSVTGSPYASPKVGNESVKVDDIHTHLKGGKNNTVINEVEGSEQDQVAGADAAAEQGAK